MSFVYCKWTTSISKKEKSFREFEALRTHTYLLSLEASQCMGFILCIANVRIIAYGLLWKFRGLWKHIAYGHQTSHDYCYEGSRCGSNSLKQFKSQLHPLVYCVDSLSVRIM